MLRKRSREDSVIGNRMDEYADYNRMTSNASVEKKWAKMQKLIQQDSDSKVVLIAVPRGTNIEDLNTLQIKEKDGSFKGLDLKKRIKKSKQEDKHYFKAVQDGKQCILEVHTPDNQDQFTQGAHMSQIATLLPKLESRSDEMQPNLELMSKGIEAFIKLDVMHSSINKTEGNSDPRLKNMVHQTLKTVRSLEDKATADSSETETATKKDKSSKKSKK